MSPHNLHLMAEFISLTGFRACFNYFFLATAAFLFFHTSFIFRLNALFSAFVLVLPLAFEGGIIPDLDDFTFPTLFAAQYFLIL